MRRKIKIKTENGRIEIFCTQIHTDKNRLTQNKKENLELKKTENRKSFFALRKLRIRLCNYNKQKITTMKDWIPAFARMTNRRI